MTRSMLAPNTNLLTRPEYSSQESWPESGLGGPRTRPDAVSLQFNQEEKKSH